MPCGFTIQPLVIYHGIRNQALSQRELQNLTKNKVTHQGRFFRTTNLYNLATLESLNARRYLLNRGTFSGIKLGKTTV